MLAKSIKNEFLNRWKQVCAILGGFFLFSLFVLVLNKLKEAGVSGEFFYTFVGIIYVVYTFSAFVAIIALVLLPFNDFRIRFFKDQGYLTHTLPVKTSVLVSARIICDICMIIILAVVSSFSVCVAVGNFDFYWDCIWGVENIFGYMGADISGAQIATIAGLGFLTVLLGVIFTLWQLNLSYAFGHMFNKGKRVLSVCVYIALNILFSFISYALSALYNIDAVSRIIDNWADNNNEIGIIIMSLVVIDAAMIIGLVLMAVGTSYIMKNHLNLE